MPNSPSRACPVCGNPVPAQAEFCIHCGARQKPEQKPFLAILLFALAGIVSLVLIFRYTEIGFYLPTLTDLLPSAENAALDETLTPTPIPASPTPQKTKTPQPSPTPTKSPANLSEPQSTASPGGSSANQEDTFSPVSGVNPKDGASVIFIPAGEFTMGNSDTNNWAASYPLHRVFLDDFWIYTTEVTNQMYQKCVDANACGLPEQTHSNSRRVTGAYYNDPSFANFPVIYVSWFDAQNYCKWAGGELPTEAQWEKAARGDDLRVYPWGNEPPSGQISWADDTVEVGSFPSGASYYGVLDMAGNAAEWVFDVKAAYPSDPQENPRGPLSGDAHVIRGGSFLSHSDGIQTFARTSKPANSTWNTTGFRCAVMSLPSDISATKTPPTPASQEFTCQNAPITRLQIGQSARLAYQDGTSTRLRSSPETGGNVIANLAEGTKLLIVDGPVCFPRPGRNDAYVYWKVEVIGKSLEGWVAEGDSDKYYIEPLQ